MMDKYVVRTPRDIQPIKRVVDDGPELKQQTIFSLKRVVVVEDIKRIKALLDIEEQHESVLLEELSKLEGKIPSREVLEETKIGLSLNKLRKHKSKEISEKATHLYRTWKNHFKSLEDKPKIEVRFDNDTSKMRQSGRKLLREALSTSKEADLLSEAIERCVFKTHRNKISLSYRKHMRRLVFLLRHDSNAKEKLLRKELSVKDVCSMKS